MVSVVAVSAGRGIGCLCIALLPCRLLIVALHRQHVGGTPHVSHLHECKRLTLALAVSCGLVVELATPKNTFI